MRWSQIHIQNAASINQHRFEIIRAKFVYTSLRNLFAHTQKALSVYSDRRVAMARESKVSLKSSVDDELSKVNEAVSFESQTIKNMIEDTGTTTTILPRQRNSSGCLKNLVGVDMEIMKQ